MLLAIPSTKTGDAASHGSRLLGGSGRAVVFAEVLAGIDWQGMTVPGTGGEA